MWGVSRSRPFLFRHRSPSKEHSVLSTGLNISRRSKRGLMFTEISPFRTCLLHGSPALGEGPAFVRSADFIPPLRQDLFRAGSDRTSAASRPRFWRNLQPTNLESGSGMTFRSSCGQVRSCRRDSPAPLWAGPPEPDGAAHASGRAAQIRKGTGLMARLLPGQRHAPLVSAGLRSGPEITCNHFPVFPQYGAEAGVPTRQRRTAPASRFPPPMVGTAGLWRPNVVALRSVQQQKQTTNLW
jgi:hypothetical protein